MNAQNITIQEAEVFADKLVAKEILNKKGKDVLLKLIQNKEIEIEHESIVKPVSHTSDTLCKETILHFCAMAFGGEQAARLMKTKSVEFKIKAEDSLLNDSYTIYPPLSGFSRFGDNYRGMISSKRSTIGLTRTRTLEDFKEIGLISDRVYQECKQALLNKSVKDEVELTTLMLDRSIYYRYYDFNVKEQKEYIELLISKDILPEKSKESLFTSYKDFNLKTLPEILAFSSRYIEVDLSSVQPDPNVVYPIILEEVKKLLPDFDFKDLRVTYLEESETYLIREDLKLSFSIDKVEYSHTFFHDYRKQVPDTTDLLRLQWVDQDFHKGINKWLTDIESPYRLFILDISEEDGFTVKKIGLVILKKGEWDIIMQSPYETNVETYDTRLSKRNIDHLISEFTSYGFFSHLTDKEIQEAKDRVNSSGIGSIEDVLYYFPKTIVLFDWETGNLENPYEELTKKLSDASRGSFSINHIVDEFAKGWKKAKRVKYGFTINGKNYETMLEFTNDWLDPKFMQLLTKAYKENGVDGDFYYCIDNGQESGYIFLTTKQHSFIQQKYPNLIKGM